MASIHQIRDQILKFEKGEMNDPSEFIQFLQNLVDAGIDVKHNGRYTKHIKKLIDEGKVTPEARPQVITLFDDLFD